MRSRGDGSAAAVRPAVVDDVPAIAALHIRAWQWAYRGQLPEAFLDQLSSGVVRREQQWVQWLGSPGESFTFVAVEGGQVLGFVHAGRARDKDVGSSAGEVYSIYLDQGAAGRGVGRRLLEEAVRSLEARGFREAVLWVLESNQRARRFYEKAGWTVDGKTQPLELGGVTVSEVRYRRTVP